MSNVSIINWGDDSQQSNVTLLDDNQIVTNEHNNNEVVLRRTLPTKEHLIFLVANQLSELLCNNEVFTAYSVTRNLRTQNPTLEIEHTRTASTQGELTVQEIVHTTMQTVMLQGVYTEERLLWGDNGVNDPNGMPAITYMPTAIATAQIPSDV